MVNRLEAIACSDRNEPVCFLLTCRVELKCLGICKPSTGQPPISRAPGLILLSWPLCLCPPPCVGHLCFAVARETQLGKGKDLSWLTILTVSVDGCFGAVLSLWWSQITHLMATRWFRREEDQPHSRSSLITWYSGRKPCLGPILRGFTILGPRL